MRAFFLLGILLCGALALSACGFLTPEEVTPVEVTRLVPETQIVTVEVTRRVPRTVVVTAEVTRVVKETVVVTAPPVPRFSIVQSAYLPGPRAHHTATRLSDGRILLVGGSQSPNSQLAGVEVLDPVTSALYQVAPLWTARHDHTATLMADGRVIVIGGYNASDQWIDDAEIYDPQSNNWGITQPIYSHGVGHTATLLGDGRVLVVGGCPGSGVCTDRVELFYPSVNGWGEAASLPSDRASHTAQLLSDGRVLITGGASAAGRPAGGDALIYDPRVNAWSATGAMVIPRRFAQSGRLPDGRVLVAGGIPLSGDQRSATAGVEIYNPATNSWTAAAPMASPRYGFILAGLPYGRFAVLGGTSEYSNTWTNAELVHEIEVYDPILDQWQVAGEFPRLGIFQAGAVLPDGRLWVTGGQPSASGNDFWLDSWILSLSYTPE